MRRLLTIIILFTSYSAFSNSDEAKTLYLQGVYAYQQKDWETAQHFFQQSLQIKPNNALTLYNLGLTEYQQQKIGVALALWRKAILLNPNLKEAQRAITFALKQVPSASQKEYGFFVGYFRKFMDWTSISQLLLVCAILMLSSGSLFFKYLGHRKRAISMDASLPPPPILASTLLTLYLLSIGLSISKGILQTDERVTVIVPRSKLRLNPAPDGITIGEVLEGTEVIIKRRSKDWIQIIAPNESVGWLNKSAIWGESYQ